MTDIEVLQEALEQKLDRLAEDCHDEIIKGHSRDGSGWAKILSPVIWAWFEREIEPLFSAFQELSLSAPSKEPSLRKRPRKRDIERLWVKWIHVKENSKMSLNDAEGFNGFVLGYELKEREKVSGVEEK